MSDLMIAWVLPLHGPLLDPTRNHRSPYRGKFARERRGFQGFPWGDLACDSSMGSPWAWPLLCDPVTLPHRCPPQSGLAILKLDPTDSRLQPFKGATVWPPSDNRASHNSNRISMARGSGKNSVPWGTATIYSSSSSFSSFFLLFFSPK